MPFIIRITVFTLVMVSFMPVANAESQVAVRPAIVIHGGAGTISRERLSLDQESAYRAKLDEAVSSGYAVLTAGGSSTDAVMAAVTVMEDSPLFNAGKGAVFTHEERVELDASIMEGGDRNAGAVAGVTRVRNPILLARDVMDHSPHVMLVGTGAEAWAEHRGFDLVPNSYFHTERRLEQVRRAKTRDVVTLSEEEETNFRIGTVGAVAIDAEGLISAATSTGGMTNKRYGRVGDSPIIGAGTWAENGVCGISATGHGEFFIRAAVAHDICSRVRYQGLRLDAAAEAVIMKDLLAMGGTGGVIGIGGRGDVMMVFNTAGMYRAVIDGAGRKSVLIWDE